MKTTRRFDSMRKRPDRAWIPTEWIESTALSPDAELVQADGRIRRWKRSMEAEGRYLRVVLSSDGRTVHNAIFDRRFTAMQVTYLDDTDTLYIELRAGEIAESRDLDENTLLDLDAAGNICAMTFEHASERTNVGRITLEGIAS